MLEMLAIAAHQPVEFGFSGVPERRMPDVVRQRQRLRQIFIETQHTGNGARDLRHLNGMRQPVAEMVGEAGREYLGLIFQAAERAGMDHAVAIALKFVAIGMRKLRISPSAGRTQREI